MQRIVKKASRILSVLVLVNVFILASCGGPRVKTTKLGDTNLGAYKTFAWLPGGDSIRNQNYDTHLLNEAIANEVNEQMRIKGYVLDRESPDLLVLVHTMFNEETRVIREPVHTSYDYYRPDMYVNPYYNSYYYYNYQTIPRVVGFNVEQIEYTEGTVVIDLIERRTNTIVWRGRAENYIDPLDVTEEVKNHINEIFNEFPS